MALASSSSSVLRSSGRLARPVMGARAVVASSGRVAADARAYATTASASASAPLDLPPTRSRNSYARPSSPTTTGPSAQAYLSDLLSLPPSRQFPADLALQMLTHKSFRYAHPIRHVHNGDDRQPAGAGSVGSEPHNSRLSFMGRRALSTYLSIFAHDAFAAAGSRGQLREDGADFLRGLGLEERLDNLRHTNNLGRTVGTEWRVGNVVRWDRNETSRESGDLKIRGMAVESILGGIYTHFGSPAAHRAFHMHVLPHLVSQLKDPRLVDRVLALRDQLKGEYKGILP